MAQLFSRPASRYGAVPAAEVYARRRRDRKRAVVGGILIIVVLGLILSFHFVVPHLHQPTITGEGTEPPVQKVIGAVSGSDGETQDATEPAPAEPVQIKIVMVGDILKHMPLVDSGYRDDGTLNYDHIYAHVTDELSGFDLRVFNQETPTAGEELGLSGYPSFNAPHEFDDAAAKAGFNVVLKASNHTMDMGYEGIHSELAYWGKNHPEVRALGCVDRDAGAAASPYEPYVFEKDGFRVALLNFTFDLNGYEDPRGAVAMMDDAHVDDVRAAIRKAKQEADMVLVFPHWGEEYELTPVEEQYQWANVFAEEGVDVVLGAHPHVIEPVEEVTRPDGGTMLCYWSVGNFVSNQPYDYQLVGGMAEVTLTKVADGTCSVSDHDFVPVICHKSLGTDFTTYLLRDYTDELAETNIGVITSNTTLTPAWAQEFWTSVVG